MSNKETAERDGTVLTLKQSQSFSGPLPHPEVLAKYDSVTPGLADRIVAMAESQSKHRQKLETEVINSDKRLAERGQILGFSISIFGLVISAVIAIWGSAIAGSIIGVGTLVSLVSVFMYGSKNKVENLNDIRKRAK